MIVLGRVGESGQRGELAEGEEHHLRVRRASDGESVELRDGEGMVGTGRLVRAGKGWEVELSSVKREEPPVPLVLAVGAGDRERFGWLVEKATELGVTAVIPLETERTAGVGSKLRPQHLDRLRRQALEAVKQCGSAWAARVEEPVALEGLLSRPIAGKKWVADAEGAPAAAELGTEPLTVVVGPEGGLTAEELRRARDAGFLPVSFGPHTLRFETAAIAAAAAAAAARLRGSHG
jgi:16S rRNA (uracil1498-N3)-methyltransferase